MSAQPESGGHRLAGGCAVCGIADHPKELMPLAAVSQPIFQRIQADHPGASRDGFICLADLRRYRARYIESVMEADRGELSALERKVIESLERHEVMSRELDKELDAGRSLGERVADRVASFGGSWWFIGAFFLILTVWIGGNSAWWSNRPFDPFPFILLNLVLSCLAAIQAPVIMMSQNRKDAKDRSRSENDYRVNLKAELEIRHLHSKVDQLLSHQWQRLLEIQQLQTEMLAEALPARLSEPNLEDAGGE